jgi:endogenous inhibitor of DNA gyrase (YacG/DUF329 family)
MSTDKKNIPCPQCGKKANWTSENTFRPFCSERCKMVDLGEWADEKYRVPGDPNALPDNDDGEDG